MTTSITLTNTLGVLEIGSLLGVFLFGVVSLQTFNYYSMYPDDSWVNKTLVATVWYCLHSPNFVSANQIVSFLFRICEIVHTVGVNYEVYQTTIILYGRPDLLMKFTVIGAVSVFGGFITLLVQVRRQFIKCSLL